MLQRKDGRKMAQRRRDTRPWRSSRRRCGGVTPVRYDARAARTRRERVRRESGAKAYGARAARERTARGRREGVRRDGGANAYGGRAARKRTARGRRETVPREVGARAYAVSVAARQRKTNSARAARGRTARKKREGVRREGSVRMCGARRERREVGRDEGSRDEGGLGDFRWCEGENTRGREDQRVGRRREGGDERREGRACADSRIGRELGPGLYSSLSD